MISGGRIFAVYRIDNTVNVHIAPTIANISMRGTDFSDNLGKKGTMSVDKRPKHSTQ